MLHQGAEATVGGLSFLFFASYYLPAVYLGKHEKIAPFGGGVPRLEKAGVRGAPSPRLISAAGGRFFRKCAPVAPSDTTLRAAKALPELLFAANLYLEWKVKWQQGYRR